MADAGAANTALLTDGFRSSADRKRAFGYR
jgi:hypothetical protein